MKKRLFSILLALCMVVCLVPTTAFAESETEETPVCTCEIACTEETMNTECPVCGAEGALAENCGKYAEPAAEGEASQPEGEELQENQDSDMPDTQSEAALAQVSGEGENGIAVQSAGVAIDNTNFPDANFRTIVEYYDTNKDSSLSDTEIAAVEEIDCYDKGISNLKGIEYFTALRSLNCGYNQLTSLDVSKNTALTKLYCKKNQLTVLDVSKNTALTYLRCNRNQLTSLDVSKNTALTKLYCSTNQLTSLDVSKNTALTKLDCYNNQLTSLDVSKNTALTGLNCGYNQLTALDVSKNTALTGLECSTNQLTSLDVSKNTALTYLDCDKNQLTSLDVSNTDMDELDCDDNIYQIVVGNDRTFDLSTLPGNFNVAKTSDWSGGTVSGNTLTVDSDQDTVTYKYDCGKNRRRTFTLKCVKSADYTKVDEAIKKANALKKDNYKDFTAVETAVKSVVRGKSITEQSEVDAMAKAIEDAIEALQYKDADYIKVDEAIAKANALNKDDYKDFSAVESAVNAVVRGKNITEQSEVDAMAKAIEDAIAALQYKDADYTKVDEAIAKANALNKDDYKDFSAVEAAVNAVVRGKNINEQSEVDAMAKAIEDAIAALQYKDADYTKVDEAIAKANALNKDEYKDFSGVEAAVNAVVRDKNITEQSEVDAMAKAIEDAIAALQYKGADYTKVDEAIAKANALNKDDYKDFSAVEAAVNAVVRGKNITEQSEVDAMAKAIEDAIAALQYKGADYTKVDEAIAKANALNKDDYKDFSAVEAAVNAVVRGKNINEQSEVDAMAKAIEDAIAALQYKGADYTKVDEAITKANALNKDDYKDFSGVDSAVNAVVRGKNITEQSEVDAMAKAIEDAIAALQYKGADYTKVDEAIAKANALNKDDYKDFSGVEAAVNAVVRGKNITEQSEVDAMAKAIEDAIAALQYKGADYTKVDEAIAKANALNKDDYKDFSGVEAAVNAVVRDKNITEQSEVDAMAKAIEDAIAALQYKDADYTKVDEAIAKANALNKDEYKDFSGVEAAVKAVVRGKNITEQSEVDKMAKTIEDAIAALQYKNADYTKVDAAIAKANALKKDDYKDFSNVEDAVKAVDRGKNITEQSEVDKMAKAIEDAIAALKYKDADYTKVDAAIAKANALNKNDYKDFSGVEAAVKAVVRGKNITEQSEVDKMAKTIEDAIAALEKKPASTKPGTSDKSPQTGDTSNLALWIVLLFISGGAAIGTTVVSRKKKYNR